MQIICPQCSEQVPAERINIQRMAAVCPACHTVFQFDPSPPRAKRQKVKQPPHLEMDEGESHLRMAFRTNFRLGENAPFLFSMFLSVFFTFLTLIVVSRNSVNPSVMVIGAGFGLATVALYYWVALTVYNKTHIEVDDEEIRVARRPLPNLLSQPETIPLAGIDQIQVEETPTSKEAGYTTPRYNLWARTANGKRRLIVGDLVEDYADFAAQRLNELLDLDTTPPTPDISPLVDTEWEAEDPQAPDALHSQSQSSHP